jgi:endonuclease/exonuclease/phosphatase family metal-dependent hydrolase
MKLKSLLCLLSIIGLLCISRSCEMPATSFDDQESAVAIEKAQTESVSLPDSTVRVMTWNIRFGIGRGPWFGDACGYKVIYSKDEIMTNLQVIAEKINQANPDILILQEVDINSTRSAYVDQLKWLLDHTHFNYAVHGSEWKAQFIPSDGLGRMEESNAILSRWPLKDAIRIQLDLRKDQSAIERYFYERCCMVETRAEIPGFKDLYIINIHASAFATDETKHNHIIRFKDELDRLNGMSAVFVAGGDLNTLPPGSSKTDYCIEDMCSGESFHNQGDNPMHKDGSNYSPESEWLVPLYDSYKSAISLNRYLADQQQYFTHTTRPGFFWDRTLDYLFTNSEWSAGNTFVRQDFLFDSDHAPVGGDIKLQKNNR